MRGTGDVYTLPQVADRITPACAGNRNDLYPGYCIHQDHPRVCGEQVRFACRFRKSAGSPPRVRGTAEVADAQHLDDRITPACAGNRRPPGRRSAGYRDHPRVCGEQKNTMAVCCWGKGSPPRVRGTAGAFGVAPGFCGITPACAGNRLKKARHFNILFCQIKRIHLV